MNTAQSIYRTTLDILTDHLERRDIEGVQRYVAIPFRMDLLDRTYVARTPHERQTLIENYVRTLDAHGVTQISRVMEDARFRSDTLVEGFHITTPLRYERAVLEPYAILSHVAWDGDMWRSTYQSIVLHDDDWSILPPKTRARLSRAQRAHHDAQRAEFRT